MLEHQNSPDEERNKKTIFNKAGRVPHAENTFVSERKSRQVSALLYITSSPSLASKFLQICLIWLLILTVIFFWGVTVTQV